jgi:hypothetical protein
MESPSKTTSPSQVSAVKSDRCALVEKAACVVQWWRTHPENKDLGSIRLDTDSGQRTCFMLTKRVLVSLKSLHFQNIRFSDSYEYP